MNTKSQQIITACEANFERFKSDCSGFVKVVVKNLTGQVIVGDANGLVTFFNLAKDGWKPLKDGDGVTAQQKANEGNLVIAGLKNTELTPLRDHGHVAVVVAGQLDDVHHKYPLAYWGMFGGIGAKGKWLQYSFNKTDRDKVHYYVLNMQA